MKMKYLMIIIPLILILSLVSCERDVSTLEPATYPTNGEVFLNGFSGIMYEAFLNSKLDAFDIDYQDTYDGAASMIITVPSEGDASGWFAGGAITSGPRDLSGYNALTFYAKASQVAEVGLVGIGNDNTGDSRYIANLKDFEVTTIWQKYILPIPDPSKLTREAGLFQFSIGADLAGNGFTVWFDEVQFETIETISDPRAIIRSSTEFSFIGDTIEIPNIDVSFTGTDVIVDALPGYLNYQSSNESVVKVEDGKLISVGSGTAVITGKLGDIDASGAITIEVGSLTSAPTPEHPQEDVISLFSNQYTDVVVDSWNPGWQYSTAVLADTKLGDDDMKQYTNLNFVGIVFTTQTLDLSEMTHFHLDFWTPDASSIPAAFNVELVDFGADNAFGGGDDSAHRIVVNANTTPVLATEQWVTIDVPLSSLSGLKSTANMAQIVLSSAENQPPNTVFIDNLYFHK